MESSAAAAFPHLLKLSMAAEAPEEEAAASLGEVVETLWRTRRTGLDKRDRARVQSLLRLPSPDHLDPVLASLRSIIRKTVTENLSREEIQNIFLKGLSVGIRNILVELLEKCQSLEEALQNQSRRNVTAAPASFLGSSLRPLQIDSTSFSARKNTDASVASIVDFNSLNGSSAPLNKSSSDMMATFPRLKSLGWTMEKGTSTASNRTSIITMKLQDVKSSSGELEVKFRISKDTLEAMLRSMVHLSDQLSIPAAAASQPSQERQ